MYSEKFLEIFKNPINAGGLQGANGVGKYVDPSCGDSIKIYLIGYFCFMSGIMKAYRRRRKE